VTRAMSTSRAARACSRVSPDETGATTTEYGILVSFIAVTLVIGVSLFGEAINNIYVGLSDWVAATF